MHSGSSTERVDVHDGDGGTGCDEIIRWLLEDTWSERFIDNLLVSLCEKLTIAGVPVHRSTLHFRVQHPQWLGARILWVPGSSGASINRFDHGIDTAPQYVMSPTRAVIEGVEEIHEKLDAGRSHRFEIFDALAENGFTEYVSWPLKHTLGRRHMISFATKYHGGFGDRHLRFLKRLVPIVAVLSEVRIKNILARTLLQTYVGTRAAEEILAGSITRGSGDTIRAAILICDMRDFTALSNLWPRDDVIDILNGYFDALCIPVEENGGEILKFMGDGLLAIFPLENAGACSNLLLAVEGAERRIRSLNVAQEGSGRPELRYGMGIHIGDVMYGNIGSESRLDFTVIGPAVNLAARLEDMTKSEGVPVLVSSDFVRRVSDRSHRKFRSLGMRKVRGVEDEIEVFDYTIGVRPARDRRG
ncbi:adenylate cyclase [Rhizobium sp. Leaf383]|nr:adenylate cyclase [Rhizobium sp. Leaf383]